MNAPLRVLYVNQWGGLGGAEISLLRVLRHLPREQVQPVLACPQGQLREAANALGVPTVCVELPSIRRGGIFRTARLQDLHSAIAQADVVHAYSVRAGWYAGIICRDLKVPMVWSVHDLISLPWQKVWLRAVARRYADSVVVYSLALRKQFGTRLAHKLFLIPHGVDTHEFRPITPEERQQVRAQFDTPPDASVVLHVGRVMPFKGQHLFLRMAQRLIDSIGADEAPMFWLAGDESMGDRRYAQYTRRLSVNISLHVRWLGFQHNIAPIIAAADVLAHCSTRPEPFGLVILEAMACGTAVVSANRGAPTELIEHEKTGVLAPPNNLEELSQSVHYLLANPERRQTMAERARHVASRFYPLSGHVQRLIEHYQSLL